MKPARWIDHLLPWISLGAIAGTGTFSPFELALMAGPLAAAALVEARRWNALPHRRFLELAALGALLLQVLLRTGLVPTTVNTLFVLCGIRLALPREAPQRRQLLLMGFLLFLVTAIANFEVDFLLWALAWTAGASLSLLHHAWEGSAALRRSLAQPPPYRRVLPWTAACAVLAGLCFVALPRQTLGLRLFPWGAAGLSGSVAGLSDAVELFDRGPIGGNREVVLRIVPADPPDAEGRRRFEAAFALLRGITLEGLEGQRWEARPDTQRPFQFPAGPYDWEHRGTVPGRLAAELFVAPSPFGLVPLPLGVVGTIPPPGLRLRSGLGGSTRWDVPSRRPLPLRILVDPSPSPGLFPPLFSGRLARLTATGKGTEAALTWSRRVAPGEPPPAELAGRLASELRSYAYTLGNPSGRAADPLKDFLERTRAGHCEYFASALALALRHRGVPARIVNGYRLGPWIEEGGYWLVTQDQAHSWVEYFDREQRAWRTEDPTPAAPPGGLSAGTFWASVQRWTDALRFRWDRHVVRFSDEDQMAGLTWAREAFGRVTSWRPSRGEGLLLGALLAAGFLLRCLRRRLARLHVWRRRPPAGIAALRPLLRAAGGEHPPRPGETARAWLLRLAEGHPDRAAALEGLAREADSVGYGGAGDARLRERVRGVLRNWKG